MYGSTTAVAICGRAHTVHFSSQSTTGRSRADSRPEQGICSQKYVKATLEAERKGGHLPCPDLHGLTMCSDIDRRTATSCPVGTATLCSTVIRRTHALSCSVMRSVVATKHEERYVHCRRRCNVLQGRVLMLRTPLTQAPCSSRQSADVSYTPGAGVMTSRRGAGHANTSAWTRGFFRVMSTGTWPQLGALNGCTTESHCTAPHRTAPHHTTTTTPDNCTQALPFPE